MPLIDIVPAALSDQELLSEVARRAASEREATATLVALLAEMDVRRLHLAEGCSSLFRYCTERLHLSEDAAYHRIEAARVARRFPIVLEHLACGELSLTTVAMLGPHLSAGNHERLLEAARGRSKREVEVLVRGVAPLPDVRASIRKVGGGAASCVAAAAERPMGSSLADCGDSNLIVPSPGVSDLPAQFDSGSFASVDAAASAPASSGLAATPAAAPRRAEIRALSPVSYSLRVTLSAEAHANLRKAQDLLRHQVPNGDPAVIVDRALTLLVEQLEREKFAKQKEKKRTSAQAKISTRQENEPEIEPAKLTTRKQDAREFEPPESARTPSATGCRGMRPSRRIPASVRRRVWDRDAGRCAFVGAGGRCTETGMLEFHHRVPFADGGGATPANIELRSHNQHEAETWERSAPPW